MIMQFKADSAAELTWINESEIIPLLLKRKGFRDETTLIAPERSKAPTAERFEWARSTFHSAVAQQLQERKIYLREFRGSTEQPSD